MDDFNSCANNDEDLEVLLSPVKRFRNDLGMHFGQEKICESHLYIKKHFSRYKHGNYCKNTIKLLCI